VETDVKRFLGAHRRVAAATGLVALFAVVAVGVFFGSRLAGLVRGQPVSAGPQQDQPAQPQSALGPAAPSDQPSLAASPSASPTPAAQPGPAVPPGPGAAPPDQPGNLSVSQVDRGTDLTVTVGWTAPKANGRAITSYVVILYSGGSEPVSQQLPGTPAIFHVACTSTCPIDGRATVQAVNTMGPGPQAILAFHDLLPHVQQVACNITGSGTGIAHGILQCDVTTPDTNDTVTWVNPTSPETTYDSKASIRFSCKQGSSVTMTATVANAAGQVIRSATMTCP
jgi:hypothetical protein